MLERETNRNVEVMWLLQRLRPDFKTIVDFRKDNREAIRQVCREFTLFSRELDLFGGKLVAIDGSKFKAVNSRGKNFTQQQTKRIISELDKKIKSYLSELDETNEQEGEVPSPTDEELQDKVAEMRSRQDKAKELVEELEECGETQISLTDPDSRSMPLGGGRKTQVGYNVQVSVDAKHNLIVDHEVTNAVTDRDLLS